MTAASSNDANPDGPGLLEPLARERGIRGKWGLLVALLAVAVIGWQWHSAHRAEQTRRKLAATERMVELEQQRAFRLRGGDRLDAALGTGKLGEWQKLSLSVRNAEAPPTDLEAPSGIYLEITASWFAELERKLRAAAGALAVADGDWDEVDVVLDQAAALLAQAEAAEARIARYLAENVWAAAAAANVDVAIRESFLRACRPWLAHARAALVAGDVKQLDEAFAKLAWLFGQSLLTEIGRLCKASDELAERLAELIRRPQGASGDGPSAWLLVEAGAIEERWVRADASTEFAPWHQANGKAKLLVEIAKEANAITRTLEAEEAKALGAVPVGIWRTQIAKMQAFEQRWWALDLVGADADLKSIVGSEEQRSRWLAEVEPTKELRARWLRLPELYRKQVAPEAEAKLAAAVASETIDFEGFRAVQAAMALATTAVGVVRKLEAEESNARGVVPVGIWRAQFAKVESFADCLRRGQMAEADALLKSIADSEEQRARWLAEVGPTKEMSKRWMQVPEAYRKQAAPDAEARLAEAVANESIDLAGFQAVQAAFRAATTEAGEAWLAASLVELPSLLQTGSRPLAMQQCEQIESWFGADERLKPIRDAHALAVAAVAKAESLRRWGLSEVAGSPKDEVTGYPKRVIHTKTGIELVLIPAGEFLMGSPTTEPGHQKDEAQHRRVIRKPFYMGVTEVTQAQWRKVMSNNPSRFQGDNLPVEQVSWQDCREFLAKVGDGMRLPSEAEWEYACRAGTTTPFAFGGTITPEQANYDGDHPYAGGARGEYRQRAVAAGSLPANPWGLHEMHGNVYEWCEDVYAPYSANGTEEPNLASGPFRVGRGGGWFFPAVNCRSALRGSFFPGLTNVFIGFRVVLAPVLVQ